MTNIKTIGITIKQHEIIQACLLKRNVSAICGRRFGKTALALFLLLYEAANIRNYKGYYLATSAEQVKRIVFDRLYNVLMKQNIRKANQSSGFMVFELKNGSKIYLKGSGNPNNLRGGDAHRIILDEAADQPPGMIDSVLSPMLADHLGKLLVIGTQRGLGSWVNELDTDPTYESFNFNSYEGGLIPAAELDRLKTTMDPLIFRQEIMGEAVATTGQIYYGYTSDVNSDQIFNPNLNLILSFDFNVNPMTVLLIQSDNHNFNAHVAVKEFVLKNTNTEAVANHLIYWLQSQGFKGTIQLTGDYSGNARRSSATVTDWQILQNAFKDNKPNSSYMKIRRTHLIRDRVNHTNQAMGNGTLKLNPLQCPTLARELNIVEWNSDGHTINDQHGKVGHISDAASYFAYNFKPLNSLRSVNTF